MVRTGVYPMTFGADSVYGLPLNETTLAEHLQRDGWATMAVGKDKDPDGRLMSPTGGGWRVHGAWW